MVDEERAGRRRIRAAIGAPPERFHLRGIDHVRLRARAQNKVGIERAKVRLAAEQVGPVAPRPCPSLGMRGIACRVRVFLWS